MTFRVGMSFGFVVLADANLMVCDCLMIDLAERLSASALRSDETIAKTRRCCKNSYEI